jgi:uncharacterized phiE125 gp8 family phage protein
MAETPMRALKRTTQPVTEPLSLAEAKLYLRVDGSEEDSLITDMIVAVREAAEDYLHKSLVTQGWTLTYENYAPACSPLPKGPVQAISHVKTRDRTGAESTVSTTLYHLSAVEDAVHFESTVMAHEVDITYSCGYGDAEDVPVSVKQGMLLHLAALYEDRIGGLSLPAAAVSLYKPHRLVRL